MPLAPAVTGLLCLCFVVVAYRRDPFVPTAGRVSWWDWFDQGRTLASTLAFLRGDLGAEHHWYPLGYSLLGVPFASVLPTHAFLPVNLVSLAATFAGAWAMARRLRLGPLLSCPVIALGLVGDPVSVRNWAVPWNTAPAAALTWGLLACCAAQVAGSRHRYAWGIGACAAGLAACRPTDVLAILPCLILTAWWCRAQPERWADLARCAAGAAAVAVPYAALHLAIYGPVPSEYMVAMRPIGFTFVDLGWRAYVLLIDPTEWFQDGAGLVHHYRWLLLGFAGLLLAPRWGRAAQLLAVTLAAHLVLYSAFVDLLPIGLWRYLNVHYFTWALPGYALLGAVLLRDLARPGYRAWAAGSLAAVLLLSAVRLYPVPVPTAEPAKVVEIAGPPVPFFSTFHDPSEAADAAGPLPSHATMRVFPVAAGSRIVGIRRRIIGTITWPKGPPPGIPAEAEQRRYGIAVSLGWPRWAREARYRSVLLPG